MSGSLLHSRSQRSRFPALRVPISPSRDRAHFTHGARRRSQSGRRFPRPAFSSSCRVASGRASTLPRGRGSGVDRPRSRREGRRRGERRSDGRGGRCRVRLERSRDGVAAGARGGRRASRWRGCRRAAGSCCRLCLLPARGLPSDRCTDRRARAAARRRLHDTGHGGRLCVARGGDAVGVGARRRKSIDAISTGSNHAAGCVRPGER